MTSASKTWERETESNQPIRARYLGHVTGKGKITLVMGSINELHHTSVFDRDGEVMEQKKRKNQVK